MRNVLRPKPKLRSPKRTRRLPIRRSISSAPSAADGRLRKSSKWSGGPSRNRTGVQGFAVLCVTTPPSGRGEGRALARASAAGQPPADANGRFDEWRLAWAAPPDKSHLDLQVYYWHRTVMTVQRPIPDFAA